jgi:hypothetical protein
MLRVPLKSIVVKAAFLSFAHALIIALSQVNGDPKYAVMDALLLNIIYIHIILILTFMYVFIDLFF